MTNQIHVGRDELVRMAPPPRPARPARPAETFRPRRTRIDLKELLPVAAIFTRTRDIVAANFGDLLDKAEDPARMIRMIVLEMEEALVEVRAGTARTIADQKEMRSQVRRLEQLRDGWDEKAELAISKGREDLARAALSEKHKVAGLAQSLTSEMDALSAALKASEADIARLQAKLREARSRQSAIQTRIDSATQRVRLREAYSGPKVDEAFSRFDVLERRADHAEARAEALALGAAPPSLEEEVAAARTAAKIDAEVAALKAAMSQSNEAQHDEGSIK
jgi:phage shock protein A